MKRPVPQPDPVAYARMKYEMENHTSVKIPTRVMGILKKNPDMSMAAKSGTPTMTGPRPTIPASVPQPAGGVTGSDVSLTTVGDAKELDNRPDARQNPPAPTGTAAGTATPAAASATTTPASATTNPGSAEVTAKTAEVPAKLPRVPPRSSSPLPPTIR